jgi:hypothetical protein
VISETVGYIGRVRRSFSLSWKNPALLSVLLLWFMITVILGVLFVIGDLSLVSFLNRDALTALGPTAAPEASLASVFNTKTAVAVGILLVLQFVIFVYVESFFKAGFYGMLKNIAHDGSTTFSEFKPEAMRTWPMFFRYLLLRDAAFLLAMLPVALAGISIAGTTPGFVTPEQNVRMLVGFGASVSLFALLNYWLLYGELLIAFKGVWAIDAVKESFRFANGHALSSLCTFLTFAWLFVLAIIISNLINLPFTYLAQTTLSQGWMLADAAVGFFLNVVTLAASVLANVYLLLTFRQLQKN